MRFQLFVCIVLGCLWSTAARAQVSAPRPFPAQTLDPAFAAMLLVSQESAQLAANEPPTAPSISLAEQQGVRRGRWLLATGVGIMAGSALGGLLAGRSHSCDYDETPLDKTAPRLTSALLGTVGLTLTVVGATRITSVPEDRRQLATAGAGQKFGRAMASLGLGFASLAIIAVTALPQSARCWSS